MSKSIQESLDLPILEDLLKASFQEGAHDEDEVTDAMVETQPNNTEVSSPTSKAIAEEIKEAIDARDHEQSMDDLHEQTIQHAKDLMDLGYNVDTRSAGRIFENAASMFKLALEAKNAKRDAQLKNKKLKLDERKQELAERGARNDAGASTVDNEQVIIQDRNELIKMYREQPK